jgi:hypothetical protein
MMVLTLGVLLRGFFITRTSPTVPDPVKFVWHLKKQEVLLFQVHVVWRRITNASTYSKSDTVTGTENNFKKKTLNKFVDNKKSIIFVYHLT